MVAELQQVTKIFGLESGRAQQVLGGIDLSISPGETLAIVGSSGSGKSTLLNILGTLEQQTSGEVMLFGQSIRGLGEKELAQLRAEKIGFIFQMHHLLPQLTAWENVLVPTLVDTNKSNRVGYEKRAMELLDRVGLAAHAQKRPGQLSGGERQRVAVVRALLKSPQLLLADEPTGALDEANALALTDLLAELNRETGVATVLVTHDLALAAKMQRTLRLHQGVLQAG
jgi:lipoprotein-releasing system ATP-binding protein